MWEYRNWFERWARFLWLASGREGSGRDRAEMEIIRNLEGRPYNALMALIKCMDYEDVIEFIAEKEDGRRLTVEGVRKRAYLAKKTMEEVFEQREAELDAKRRDH